MSGHIATRTAFVRTADGVTLVGEGERVPVGALPSSLDRLAAFGAVKEAPEQDQGAGKKPDGGGDGAGGRAKSTKSRKPKQSGSEA